MDVAELLGIADGLLRPRAGHQVVGRLILRQEVHRDHEELRRRPAGQEQDVVVVGDLREVPAIGDRLQQNGRKRLAAMRVLHHADPRLAQGPDVFLALLEDLFRHDGRTGGEVENAIGHGRDNQA